MRGSCSPQLRKNMSSCLLNALVLVSMPGTSKSKEKWEGGRIYNPKNGKNYKCSIWLDGDQLKVRGYIGVFYETQTWKRKK